MMGALNPWLIIVALLAIAGSAAGGYFKGHHDASQAWQLSVTEDANAALKAQQKLQEQVNAITVQSQKDKSAIAGRLAAALDELRNRPLRLSESARAACDGVSGRELSAPDAGFLVREASRADRLRTDLDACQKWVKAVTGK